MHNSQLTDITILLVEDDKHISQLYTTKLTLEGYAVEQAYNGLEALHKCHEKQYALILLDLRMPVMDGETFLDKFRRTNQTTPVIILTNLNKEEAPKTLWHHGISGYYVKAHSTPNDLAKIVTDTLQ